MTLSLNRMGESWEDRACAWGGKRRLPIREGRHCVPLVVRRCARMTCVPYRRRQSTAPKSGAPKSVRSAAAGQSLDIDGIHLHLTRKPIKPCICASNRRAARRKSPHRCGWAKSHCGFRQATFVDSRPTACTPWLKAQRRSIIALNGRRLRERRSWCSWCRRPMMEALPVVEKPVISVVRGGDPGPGQTGTDVNNRILTRSQIWTDERKRQAAAAISTALPQLLASGGRSSAGNPHITLRVMTSRWGSCTPRTGRIRLNLQLGLMEPQFLEPRLGP